MFRLWVRSVTLISNHPVHSQCVRLAWVSSHNWGAGPTAHSTILDACEAPLFALILRAGGPKLRLCSFCCGSLCVFKYFLMKLLRHWLMNRWDYKAMMGVSLSVRTSGFGHWEDLKGDTFWNQKIEEYIHSALTKTLIIVKTKCVCIVLGATLDKGFILVAADNDFQSV